MAIGGDLHPARLIDAYSHGIFPWFNDDSQPAWFSPDPRAVMRPGGMHISKSLAKRLRAGTFRVTVDQAFRDVIDSCAAPRPNADGTWITPGMRRAYGSLHELGLAHSVEAWQDGKLAGGLYGVSLGRMFFGESMFSLASDASKVALAHLHRATRAWRFTLIDCQVMNPHMRSLGAYDMPRARFLAMVADNRAEETRRGPWTFEHLRA